jgi:hypothetical protein
MKRERMFYSTGRFVIRHCVGQDIVAIWSGPAPSGMRSGSVDVLCAPLLVAMVSPLGLSASLNSLYPDISQSKFVSPIGPVFALQVCH